MELTLEHNHTLVLGTRSHDNFIICRIGTFFYKSTRCYIQDSPTHTIGVSIDIPTCNFNCQKKNCFCLEVHCLEAEDLVGNHYEGMPGLRGLEILLHGHPLFGSFVTTMPPGQL